MLIKYISGSESDNQDQTTGSDNAMDIHGA